MTSSPHVIRTLPQLGMLLKSARRDRKLSQTRLAHRVGIGQSRVSELESDPSAMTLKQLMAWCSELGLELSVGERKLITPAVDAAW